MNEIEKKKALERFLRYVKIDTQSDDTSISTPSTLKQLNLAKELKEELGELGIDAEIDEYGRVYAHLAGEAGVPVIGLNSHMDTALETSGKDVKPRIVENYDGGDIALSDEVTLSPKDFPDLLKHVGDSLVVTGGDTLLGGDDKAGDAIIMGVLDILVHHPEIKHHPLSILFTPDEEIGRGPEHFDARKFGADFAYTVDGSDPDLIDVDNFNGAHAIITISGVDIHPGEAKGKMLNAIRLGEEFDALLPTFDRPEYTEGFEGFNHLLSFEGSAAKATLRYIIRNHSSELLEKQKNDIKTAADYLQRKYPRALIEVEIKDDYRNMHEILEKDPRAVEHAKAAFRRLGLSPRHEPVRGGTDGATFSFLGCPCPNLGTGSYNHHGRYEYLVVSEFEKMIDIVLEIAKI